MSKSQLFWKLNGTVKEAEQGWGQLARAYHQRHACNEFEVLMGQVESGMWKTRVCSIFVICFDFVLLLFSCPVMSDSFWPHGLQYARPPYLSSSSQVCPNSCKLHWWLCLHDGNCWVIGFATLRKTGLKALFLRDWMNMRQQMRRIKLIKK